MPFELIKPDTNIDFLGQAKYVIALSAAIVLAASSRCSCAIRRYAWASTSPAVSSCSCASRRRPRSTRPASATCSPASTWRAPTWSSSARRARRCTCCASSGRRVGEKNELVDQLRDAFAAQLGGVEVERVEFVGPKVGEDLRRDGLVSLGDREPAAADLHRLPLHADLRAGRHRGADPRRAGDRRAARDPRLRVRSHRARRAAHDPRLQHQRQDRDLRPHPREPGRSTPRRTSRGWSTTA